MMKKVYASKPVASEHTLNAAFKNHNGRNYICTTVSGSPAILNIYDLDCGRAEKSFELPGSLNSWNHLIGEDGRLYVMTYARLYRYDFSTGEFKSFGCVCEGEGECFAVTGDGKGNIYFGSCPGGKIIRFGIYDESFTDLGQVAPGVSYVRSIAYHNGYIYCGVKGDSVLAFYKIDAENPSFKQEIPVPLDEEYYPGGLRWLYTFSVAGDKIIIHTKADGICPLLVYDIVKERFVDTGYKGDFPGLFSSPEKNGKSYFINEGRLMEIELKSGRVSEADFPEIDCCKTMSVDFIKDGASGKEVMAVMDNVTCSVVLIDLEDKSWKKLKLNPEKGRYYIQSVEAGDYENGDNGIYIGAYCGDRSVRYDVVTGEETEIVLGQPEGMTSYNGIQYMGVYPGNMLYSYDCKKPLEEPVLIGKMATVQDRPFAMCSGDGCIFMGTVPDYGIRGGDIVVYNTVTGENLVINEPVKEQSIIGICYRDGIIYGSTSVWGGLGSNPDDKPACVFRYSLLEGKMLNCFVPEIPGIENPTWIGEIELDEEGRVWAVTGNTLFEIDFSGEKVLSHITFAEYTYSRTSHRWRPTYIRFGKSGILYTNINGIRAVNKETLEHKKLTEEDEVFLFALDRDERIYYAVDNNFYILKKEEEIF